LQALSSRSSLAKAEPEAAERRFVFLLVSIAIAGLLLRMYVAARSFINFDEWQQVFMASAPRWQDLTYELRAEAHPPLFYLLLKGLYLLGHSKLVYRSIAYLPGAGSILVIGLIARKLLRTATAALLCAGALAVSAAAITTSVEIRQYQLAVFLVLVAFRSFLLIWRNEQTAGRRHYAIFAISSTLAVACHYSVIFFLGACVVITASRQAFERRWDGRRLSRLIAALALPIWVFAVFYFIHGRRQELQGYLYEFYWGFTPHESLSGFLSRNLLNFWNLFSPVPMHSRPLVLLCIAVLGAISAAVGFRARNARRATALPLSFAAVIILELAALSLARRYPFGGMLRHQYIVSPFLILTMFVIIDRLLSSAARSRGLIVLSLTGLLLVGNLVAQWSKLIIYPGGVAYAEDFLRYRTEFPAAQGIYLDHWGIIAFFIQTDDRPRDFVRRIADRAMIDEYHRQGPPPGTEIFYDKTRNVADVSDPTLYRALATCLGQLGINELGLVVLSPGAVSFAQTPDTLRKLINDGAATHGLAVTKVVLTPKTIFAGFRLLS
jgi:uncharacterized membrane protein